jgi:hypothetical protein
MLNLRRSLGLAVAMGAGVLLAGAGPAMAGTPYTVQYTDGTSWASGNGLYVQGFSPSLTSADAPAIPFANPGDTVDLTQFQTFKSGNADAATNIQLVILNNLFPSSPNVSALTTFASSIVAVSTNTIANDTSIATGAPIAFTFNNVPLIYGNSYAAMFANISTTANGDGSFNVTPILVSSLVTNYVNTGVDTGSGVFHPATNYGTESQFQYATSDFINSGFFSDFNYAGDEDFVASLTTVPEPASLSLFGLAAFGLLRRRSR